MKIINKIKSVFKKDNEVEKALLKIISKQIIEIERLSLEIHELKLEIRNLKNEYDEGDY